MVGREAELAVVTDVVDCAAATGGCVLITGQAGVGKTRLAVAVATRARARGQAVLVGRAAETDQISPLRPIAEALLDGARDRPVPTDPALRPYLPALATLVPQWRPQDASSGLNRLTPSDFSATPCR